MNNRPGTLTVIGTSLILTACGTPRFDDVQGFDTIQPTQSQPQPSDPNTPPTSPTSPEKSPTPTGATQEELLAAIANNLATEPPSDHRNLTHFQSPSGNIICGGVADQVFCQIHHHRWRGQYANTTEQCFNGVALTDQAIAGCGDYGDVGTVPTIGYGHSVDYPKHRCKVQKTGVTCVRKGHSAAFTIAVAALQITS